MGTITSPLIEYVKIDVLASINPLNTLREIRQNKSDSNIGNDNMSIEEVREKGLITGLRKYHRYKYSILVGGTGSVQKANVVNIRPAIIGDSGSDILNGDVAMRHSSGFRASDIESGQTYGSDFFTMPDVEANIGFSKFEVSGWSEFYMIIIIEQADFNII